MLALEFASKAPKTDETRVAAAAIVAKYLMLDILLRSRDKVSIKEGKACRFNCKECGCQKTGRKQ